MNEEILGGLRFALNRGESLEKTMTSFYNAGYRREEIEEAARFLKQERIPRETNLISSQNLKPLHKISAYGQKKSKNSTKKIISGVMIAIILATILFVGLLITFLFTS